LPIESSDFVQDLISFLFYFTFKRIKTQIADGFAFFSTLKVVNQNQTTVEMSECGNGAILCVCAFVVFCWWIAYNDSRRQKKNSDHATEYFTYAPPPPPKIYEDTSSYSKHKEEYKRQHPVASPGPNDPIIGIDLGTTYCW
jgi:hypothetical protein